MTYASKQTSSRNPFEQTGNDRLHRSVSRRPFRLRLRDAIALLRERLMTMCSNSLRKLIEGQFGANEYRLRRTRRGPEGRDQADSDRSDRVD